MLLPGSAGVSWCVWESHQKQLPGVTERHWISRLEAEGVDVWVTAAAAHSRTQTRTRKVPYEPRVGASSLNQQQHLHSSSSSSSSEATWQTSNWISDTSTKINSPQLLRYTTLVLETIRLSQIRKGGKGRAKRWKDIEKWRTAKCIHSWNCKGRRQRWDKGTVHLHYDVITIPKLRPFPKPQAPCWGLSGEWDKENKRWIKLREVMGKVFFWWSDGGQAGPALFSQKGWCEADSVKLGEK